MALLLHIIPANGSPFDYRFDSSSLVIGRSRESHLVIDDEFLSRKHARLFISGGQPLIEDLGSQNGTWMNRRRVRKPMAVKPGAVIKLSNSVISVRAGSEVSEQKKSTVYKGFHERSVFRDATALLDIPKIDRAEKNQVAPYLERLKLLNEIHHALGESVALEPLLDLILDRVFTHLKPEQCAIFLRESTGELVPAATRSLPGLKDEFFYSRHLVEVVVEKGMAALVDDLAVDQRFSEAASMISSGIRSLVAAPLSGPDAAIGMIVLHSRAAIRQFSEEDMALLVSLASVAALRIRNLALAEEAAQRQRLEQELGLARRIQEALIPASLPRLAGYDIFGQNLPSQGVSGDYFQVRTRLEGRECVLMVVDVSGKGMSASLLTASLEALSAAPIEDGLPPEEVCAKLSRMVYRRTPKDRYATLFLAMLNPASGALQYANAGHNPAILIREDGASEIFGGTGLPVGIMPNTDYERGSAELGPGDLLAIYTDGLTEATDLEGREYGPDRLTDLLTQKRHRPLAEIADTIQDDLEQFVNGVPFNDDRTLVLLRRHAEAR